MTATKKRANWRTPGGTVVDGIDESTDRAAWLRERRNGIGGSDAAALLGVHISTTLRSAVDVTPATVFADKLATDEPTDDDKDIFHLGHVMEDALLSNLRDGRGLTTRPAGFIRSRENPFMYANPDALTSDGGIAECKTASNRSRAAEKWLAGDISEHAYVQGQHYLYVTGREHLYYTVAIRNDYTNWESVPRDLWGTEWFREMAFKEFVQVGPIERDPATIDAIVEAAREFWAAVQTGTMPPHIAAYADPATRFPIATPDRNATPAIPEMVADDLTRLRQVKAAQTELATERSAIEDRVKKEIGDAEYLAIDGTRVARWRSGTKRQFDKKAMAAAHPDLVDTFTRTVPTRTLTLMDPEGATE